MSPETTMDIVIDMAEYTRQAMSIKKDMVSMQRQMRSNMALARKTWRAYMGISRLMGDAVSETVRIVVESVFAVGELLIETAMAQTITGWGVAKAGVQIALVIALFAKARALENEQMGRAAKIEGLVSAFEAFTYMFVGTWILIQMFIEEILWYL